MALHWAIVQFTCGEADVSWRSCSHVQDQFTSRGTVTFMFRSHVQLSGSRGGSMGSTEPPPLPIQSKLFYTHGECWEKLSKLIKSNPPQQIITPVPNILDPPLQLLFTLGSDSKLRYCEYIYHCSGIELSIVTVVLC